MYLFMEAFFSIHVFGKVQGVFFRASTKEKADELSIKGFVRNEPDGSVYIEASGDEGSVKEFIKWCNHGPGMAQVVNCVIQEIDKRNFSKFEISR